MSMHACITRSLAKIVLMRAAVDMHHVLFKAQPLCAVLNRTSHPYHDRRMRLHGEEEQGGLAHWWSTAMGQMHFCRPPHANPALNHSLPTKQVLTEFSLAWNMK